MEEIKERLTDKDVCHQYAPCRYCGQLYLVHGTVEYDEEELERIGTGQCTCPQAVKAQKQEKRRVEAEKIAREWIPNDWEEQKFVMMMAEQVIRAESSVVTVTVKYNDDTQITIKEMSNGNIRMTRKQGKKAENEI